MANPASSSSFYSTLDNSEYTDHSLWDYNFEEIPSTIVHEVLNHEPEVLPSTSVNEVLSAPTAVEDDKRDEEYLVDVSLSMEQVSKYFHMPMCQAAKELKIGETVLKKRCRRLGIRRWPYRKLMSLKRTTDRVREYGKVQGGGPEITAAIKGLENEREMLLRDPNLELEKETKRLRDACSRSSYKERTFGLPISPALFPASSSRIPPPVPIISSEDKEEDETIKSLLSDFCPPCNIFDD